MDDSKDPQREAFLADLEMVVDDLHQRLARLREECIQHGDSFTAEQEARWEGAFIMLRGILLEELIPMLDAWKGGHHYSRKGEQLMRKER